MTAPTNAVQILQKSLANGAPSTHDPLYACVSADGLEVFAAKLEKAAKEQKRLK
jgi:hypothetical protein